MRRLTLPLLIVLIIILNVLIYYRALMVETADMVFAECARNSGRTSAAINLILLLIIGRFGLKAIYKEKTKLSLFRTLITLFTVNHLIHFFFVSQSFKLHEMELGISENLHGFITFLCVVLVPIVVYAYKRLNTALYYLLIVHFFNVTYFISISFYARYKPDIDPAYLHRIGILIMISALVYILYRVYAERSVKLKTDP